MGILDEAIREHLDLKRRLGAGEDELQRLEDEAFGPPSRPGDPDFPERSDEGELVTGEEAAVAEAPAEAGEAEAPAAEAAIAEPEPASPATEESEQPDFYDAGAEPDEELDLELSLDEEEPAPSADDDAPPISSLDTVEHHYEEAMDEAEVVESEAPPAEESEAEPEPSAEPEDSAEEEEDVLEETPEFLQDAPEDDELWFEQGEPKDFDF
jgi:hypothetical protein